MHEVERYGHIRFIRTEGEISIEWLREVTGEELSFSGEDCYEEDYPCGAPLGNSLKYNTKDGRVAIHPDRICTRYAGSFLETISDYLTTRPDLKELLKSI